MQVKGNHPLAEIIAKKLFSIESVPKEEQMKMVNRACKSAVEWHEEQRKQLMLDAGELIKALEFAKKQRYFEGYARTCFDRACDELNEISKVAKEAIITYQKEKK